MSTADRRMEVQVPTEPSHNDAQSVRWCRFSVGDCRIAGGAQLLGELSASAAQPLLDREEAACSAFSPMMRGCRSAILSRAGAGPFGTATILFPVPQRVHADTKRDREIPIPQTSHTQEITTHHVARSSNLALLRQTVPLRATARLTIGTDVILTRSARPLLHTRPSTRSNSVVRCRI